MSIISDFLIKQIKEKGWLSVGNIMFEDGVPVLNPATTEGNICLSPGSELVFSTSRMDTHNTYVIENAYLAQDFSRAGVEQTIVVEPFDRLRHFDTLLLSQWIRQNADETAYVAPKYPKPADIEAMVPDEETGLFPDTDTFMCINGVEESTISPYPKDTVVSDYVGIRVAGYKKFLENQKKFCQLIKDLYGLSDCI
ncbi:MAG: hypothetical protein NC489_08870 [Ruminococcus flavefaciens]|nr:hypothetical protein [Ruminococcus flavefaciens]